MQLCYLVVRWRFCPVFTSGAEKLSLKIKIGEAISRPTFSFLTSKANGETSQVTSSTATYLLIAWLVSALPNCTNWHIARRGCQLECVHEGQRCIHLQWTSRQPSIAQFKMSGSSWVNVVINSLSRSASVNCLLIIFPKYNSRYHHPTQLSQVGYWWWALSCRQAWSTPTDHIEDWHWSYYHQ